MSTSNAQRNEHYVGRIKSRAIAPAILRQLVYARSLTPISHDFAEHVKPSKAFGDVHVYTPTRKVRLNI